MPFWFGMDQNDYPSTRAGRIRGGLEMVFWPVLVFITIYRWFWKRLGAEPVKGRNRLRHAEYTPMMWDE
jgi:hypothetical protein